MSKGKIIWSVIVLAIIVAGISAYRSRGTKTEYSTQEAVRGDLSRTVSVTGTLVSEKEAELSFQTSGKVQKIAVEVGNEVKEGQILAYLDQSAPSALYRQYQSEVEIQQEALDLSRRHWDDLKPEEKQAKKLAVEKAKAARDSAYADMKKSMIRAPFPGQIARIDADEGVTVSISETVMKIVSGEGMEIEADVPESDVADIATGQSAKITFDALSQSDIFDGEISLIDSSSTVIQDVVYYRVRLSFPDPDQRLRSGMSCDIDINTALEKDVIMIPGRAVKSENGRKYVEVLGDDGKTAEKKYVETGISGDEGMIEIKSGISEGEKVITLTKEN